MEDFVMTISDEEGSIPDLENPETELENLQPEISQKSKKRKRQDTEAFNGSTRVNGSIKKTKGSGIGKSIPKIDFEKAEPDVSSEEGGEDDGAMNPDFEFQLGDVEEGIEEGFDGWGLENRDDKAKSSGDKKGVDIDEIIARRRNKSKGRQNGTAEIIDEDQESDMGVKEGDLPTDSGFEDDEELFANDVFGMGAPNEDEEEDERNSEAPSDEDSLDSSNSENDDQESAASPIPHPEDMESDSELETEDPREAARRKEFFAPEEPLDLNGGVKKSSISSSFHNMSLSRPVLKGLAAVGFSTPTPIQSKTIPVALLGKDVVGGAVTGSGKTAAFLVPILERLLYRPKKVPTSRVAILMPTRELAVQCHNVAVKLASFTDISFCRLVGGFSLREQEVELRKRPDVIIATPGRFIDHMRNSASFTVDTLEILILDEADRMLEDGFADELNEILTTIPKSRQTMLFSATMTNSVDKLIRVGMTRPVRLMVDARKQTVGTLVQEFLRLRPGREDKRLAYLLVLCSTLYNDRVIIFFRQKKEAHRVRIIFGLCGLKAAELHGSMSQEQRINSVESFRSGRASFLLATDLASRGLDIKGVETVINYEAPQSHEIYLHRVGRTARAGRSGRACTIAAEPDRKVVKSAVKSAREQGAKIVSRVVEADLADEWAKKLDALEDEVEEVLKEEKEEKALGQAEMQVKRGQNFIDHEEEIMSRPKRTWFESEREKKLSKKTGMEQDSTAASEKKGKKKLSNKDKKRLDDRDVRKEGKVWKKGKAERAGSGAVKSPKGKPKNSTKPAHKSAKRKR